MERASESLTKNARNLMMVSVITATLMAGVYGVFAGSTGFQTLEILAIFLANMSAMMLAVVQCMRVSMVKFQRTVLLDANMTKGSKMDLGIIKGLAEVEKDDYCKKITDKYTKYLEDAEDKIGCKTKLFDRAICAFLGGLLLFLAAFALQLSCVGGVRSTLLSECML